MSITRERRQASKKNEDGYTQIRYHLPRIRSSVNSAVEREIWEDSEAYVFFSGKKIVGRIDQYEGSLDVSARLFASRHLFYALRAYLIAGEGKRFDRIDYKYEVFEIRSKSSRHYECQFKSRLASIASPAQRRRVAESNADGLYLEVMNSLIEDGTDLIADKCRLVP